MALGCRASAIIYQNTRVYGDYQLIIAINASTRQLTVEPNATSRICLIGGPWEYYDASDIFGWEGSRVVAVTTGANYRILGMVTRAKTDLIIILFEIDIWITQKNVNSLMKP